VKFEEIVKAVSNIIMIVLLITVVLLLSFMLCVLMMMFVIYWRVFALAQIMICEIGNPE
jgi:hypothetical protein